MKVLLLGEFGELNGGEYSCLAMLEQLTTYNDVSAIQFAAAVPSPSPFAEALNQLNCKIFALAIHDSESRKLPQLQLRNQIKETVIQFQPDIVHANSLSMSRTLGPIQFYETVVKLGHLRDIIKLNKANIADLNQLDHLIAVSDATRRFHIDQGLCAKKTTTCYNGVDLQQFRPREKTGRLHRELKIENDRIMILSIGQLGLRKAQNILLESFQRVAEKISTCHLVILGERNSKKAESIEFEQKLHKTVRQAGLEDRVHFLGRRSDISEIMNESALLVHCAHQEPLGRVLLEAGASGLPIVATDVGGTREILMAVTHDQEGELNSNALAEECLVEPNHPVETADAIEKLLRDPGLRKSLADKLCHRIQQKFSIESSARQLVGLYRQLLSY